MTTATEQVIRPTRSTSRPPTIMTMLIVTVVLLLAGEGIGEMLGLGHPLLARDGGPANYEFLPNQNIHRLWPLNDHGWISRVRTNAYGMRSDPISPIRKPGTLRVYFLGDSFTYGTTQVDQNALFSEIVHRELPAIVHEPVEVMNGSASGWAPANELAYLKEHGTLHADRLILVLNDGDPTQPMSPVPVGYGIPTPKYNPRFAYEEIWERLLRPDVDHMLKQLHLRATEAPSLRDPGLDVHTDAVTLEQNLAFISQIRSYAVASGTKMSILYVPFAGMKAKPTMMAEAAPGREAIQQWAAENKVPFVNLGPAIWSHPADQLLLPHNGHYNTRGHRLIATLIEQNWKQLSQ